MPFTSIEVAQAISRANGQKLNQIKTGGLNAQTDDALGRARNIKVQGSNPYAKLTGHTFAHVATFSQGAIKQDIKDSGIMSAAKKSLWQDRRTVVAAATEMMNSPQVAPVVLLFASGPVPSGPERVLAIPLSDNYYGFEPGVNDTRKVESGTIIFYMAAGTLYITSCYPETFIAGAIGLRDDNYDLGGLFD
jgi:hypothetical protein